MVTTEKTPNPETQDLAARLSPDLTTGLQDIVAEKISNAFQAKGISTPEIIRDKRNDGNNGNLSIYAIIGLIPPYEIGGEPVIAELDITKVTKTNEKDIAVYTQMPGCDGYKILSLGDIADGLVDAYNHQVSINSMNL